MPHLGQSNKLWNLSKKVPVELHFGPKGYIFVSVPNSFGTLIFVMPLGAIHKLSDTERGEGSSG